MERPSAAGNRACRRRGGVYCSHEVLWTLAAKYLSGFRPATGSVIAFLAVFIACVILASVVGWIVGKLVSAAGLGILNRIGGGILGGAKGCLIVSIVVMMLIAFMPPHSGIFKGSRTMKYIQPMAGLISRFAPENIGKRYDEKSKKMGKLLGYRRDQDRQIY